MGKAKTKHPKPKPSKQSKEPHTRKRGGKLKEICELNSQLDALGLRIIHVTSDGNCFFRALADQLEGNEDEHEKYRKMVVQFIKDNRGDFEPFVEDGIPFDEYCQSMAEDGTWAGQMELEAARRLTGCHICIHQDLSPRLYMRNFKNPEARTIHLSYHEGVHYNSVRSKQDTCSGPARPFVIEGDADLLTKSNPSKVAVVKSKQNGMGNVVDEGSIKLIMAGSRCEDARKVEQVLQQVGGDVDAAIEVLIAEQGSADQIVADYEFSHSVKGSKDGFQDEKSELHKFNVENEASKTDSSGDDTEITYKRNRVRSDEKKISRNKACPCGSKKKYKSCCGTAARQSSSGLPVNQTVDYGKSRKEREQGRKSGLTVVNSIQSNGAPPDMGGLCI